MRNLVLWITLAVILGTINFQIFKKQQILSEGETVLLQLAPRDPRSFLQGDYMSLNYALANEIRRELTSETSITGLVLVQLDEHKVAHYLRLFDDQQNLRPQEKLLFFRKRGSIVRVGSDAFFFQEGQGKYYRAARYGELKVAANGEAVLVGLRDEEFNILDAAKSAE